jgi:cell division transport system permease protein
MALKVDYVVRETGTNLRRNLTLSFATMVTIAIALTLVGASLLMRQGVTKSNVRFHGNIQTIIYMKPDARQEQVDFIRGQLTQNPHVASFTYLDHHAAHEEFLQIFWDKPEIQKSLPEEATPTSYKLKFNGDADAAVVQSVKDQFKAMPAVLDVIAPDDQVRKQEDSFARFSNFALIIALIVGATSLVLIINSIRIAMFARRREIEVMKLVGATNWFIRVPFMAEGLVQGIIGGIIGIATVAVLRTWMLPTLVDGGGIWTGFHLDVSDVQGTSYVLILAGAVVGIVGSAVAATRFLDV